MKRILSLCLSLAVVPFASAEILEVPGSFPTIQAAIDAASGGDVVLVAPGAYIEAIDYLGKGITVRSEEGPEETSIKAPPGNNTSTVTFNSKEPPTAKFIGFKVGGGNGTPIEDPIFGSAVAGGGLFCSDAHPTIEGCEFRANSVGDSAVIGHGGGMFLRRSNAIVRACAFTLNSSTGHGGGIYIYDNSDPTIESCSFDTNSASWGGGVTCTVSSSPTFSMCNFEDNHVVNVGGGIYIRSWSSPRIEHSTFRHNIQEGNPSAGGAAITVYGSGNGGGPCFPLITETRFESNRAQGYGGAIHNAYGAETTVEECTFVLNTSEAGGAGIDSIGHPKAPASLDVLSSVFEGNVSGGNGGAINLRATSASIADCTIQGNSAALGGGGIAFDSTELSEITLCSICGNTPNQTTGDFNDGGGNSIGDTCESCVGDLNGDGVVNSADIGLLLAAWGGPGDADLNGDGVVNAADLGLELASWGPCGA